MTLLIFGVGILVYVVQWFRNRAAGIDTGLMYQEIPPD
jgi:hypothetical protein